MNITELVLQDIHFADLAKSTSTSINFTSIKGLSIIQCQKMPLLWKFFITAGTSIERLLIRLLDWTSEHEHNGAAHGFEAFIRSFSSLLTLCVKVCSTWQPDFAIWQYHRGLSVFDVDSTNNCDLAMSEMDILAENFPNIHFFGSRNMLLGAPLQDGD